MNSRTAEGGTGALPSPASPLLEPNAKGVAERSQTVAPPQSNERDCHYGDQRSCDDVGHIVIGQVHGTHVLGEFLLVKMLGVALATLIRSALVPALLTLAGRWNWWPGNRPSSATSWKVT